MSRSYRCGHCQRFAPSWKKLAKDTKAWHDKVMRVAAVDCALVENEDICLANNVMMYPTFAFFKPFANDTVGIVINKTRDYVNGGDYFISLMFDFLEKLNETPANFPVLNSYKYVVRDFFFLKL
jgi:thiol oxidase